MPYLESALYDLVFTYYLVQFLIQEYGIRGATFEWSHFKFLVDFIITAVTIIVVAVPEVSVAHPTINLTDIGSPLGGDTCLSIFNDTNDERSEFGSSFSCL